MCAIACRPSILCGKASSPHSLAPAENRRIFRRDREPHPCGTRLVLPQKQHTFLPAAIVAGAMNEWGVDTPGARTIHLQRVDSVLGPISLRTCPHRTDHLAQQERKETAYSDASDSSERGCWRSSCVNRRILQCARRTNPVRKDIGLAGG